MKPSQLYDRTSAFSVALNAVFIVWRPSITGTIAAILIAIWLKLCAIAARMDER